MKTRIREETFADGRTLFYPQKLKFGCIWVYFHLADEWGSAICRFYCSLLDAQNFIDIQIKKSSSPSVKYHQYP